MGDEQEVEQPQAKTVDYDKYQRVVSAKQGLERQVEELKTEAAALSEKAATVDTLATQVGEWRSKAEEASGKFSRWQDIATRIGTTDADAIEAVEWQYGRIGGDDRPALGDWLDGLKAEPDKAPTILRPLLGSDAAQPKPKPKDKAGSAAPPAAGSQYSAEEIRAIRIEATRTGDWQKYREIRKAWTRS